MAKGKQGIQGIQGIEGGQGGKEKFALRPVAKLHGVICSFNKGAG